MNEFVDVDLTKYKAMCGVIGNKEDLLELYLVTNYQQHVTSDYNMLSVVNEKIASKLYKGSGYAYKDIMAFYREKDYVSHIIKYRSILEHLILKDVSPYVDNIKFDRVISDDPYVVRFKLFFN